MPEAGKVAAAHDPDRAAARPGSQISETFLFDNQTKLTYSDPAKGSASFTCPDAARGKMQVTVNAPSGMPIQRPAAKDQRARRSIKSITR